MRSIPFIALALVACGHSTSDDVHRPPPVCTPSTTATYPATYPGGTALVVKTLYYGDADRDALTFEKYDAWKRIGEDIDGIASVRGEDHGECTTRGAFNAAADDGEGGIDNAFAHLFVPYLELSLARPTQTVAARITAGDRAPMFLFGGWPRGADAKSIEMGFAFADKADPAPSWNGSDTRHLAGAPATLFPSAFACGHEVDSGIASAPLMMELPIGPTATIRFPLRHAHARMSISADGTTATNGVLSGVILAKDLEQAFRDVAGDLGLQCDSPAFDDLMEEIHTAPDILSTGRQDPYSVCDAISFGIGFDAVAATPGGVASPETAPAKNACTP
jgi:hypothetical protein